MRALALFLSMCVAAPAGAATQQFVANLADARWESLVTGERCELVHRIPAYGQASFVQVAREELAFSLEVIFSAAREDLATLATVPPPWQHGAEPRELGMVRLVPGASPVVLERRTALRLLFDLAQGRSVELRHSDVADGLDEVTAIVSPVRFREAYADFERCVAALPRPEPVVPVAALIAPVVAEEVLPVVAPAEPAPRSWVLRLEDEGAVDPQTRAAIDAAAAGLIAPGAVTPGDAASAADTVDTAAGPASPEVAPPEDRDAPPPASEPAPESPVVAAPADR